MNCSVIEIVTHSKESEEIEEERNKLVQSINLMSRMNHHLFVQYLGVKVE